MKFESSENKPLDENAAHEEANMLRAQLKVSPETGRIPGSEWDKDMGRSFETKGEAPTAEDCDNALAAVEEMKKIAAEEPTFERIVNKLKDLPLKAGAGIELAFRAMGVVVETFSIAGDLDPNNKENEGIGGAMKRRWERSKTDHENDLLGMFNSAENNLKVLKARAQSYGKQENIGGTK